MFKIIIAFVIFSTTSFAQTAMISHKGIWKDMLLPQNTKESLLRAFEHGFDGIEFDTYKTVDDVFILAHDDSLDKVTTCTGLISKSLYSQIQHCQVIKNTLLPIIKLILHKMPIGDSTITGDRVEVKVLYRVILIPFDLPYWVSMFGCSNS